MHGQHLRPASSSAACSCHPLLVRGKAPLARRRFCLRISATVATLATVVRVGQFNVHGTGGEVDSVAMTQRTMTLVNRDGHRPCRVRHIQSLNDKDEAGNRFSGEAHRAPREDTPMLPHGAYMIRASWASCPCGSFRYVRPLLAQDVEAVGCSTRRHRKAGTRDTSSVRT